MKMKKIIKNLFTKIKVAREKYTLKKFYKKNEKVYKKYFTNYSESNSFEDFDLVSDKQFDEQEELDTRNHLYSNLLRSYVVEYARNQNKKNRLKWRFFHIIAISFVAFLLLLAVMWIVVTIYFNEEEDAVVVSFFVSFMGIFSTLAIMPHTVAKYLFNPKEDEIISKLVTDMQAQDNHTKEINLNKKDKSHK